ncbi:MAG TPA: DegT/DnrJ/EryC1/StrS aminotransferase family protein [Terriglobales bacterium]|nr:DegT/DnrJ/EryC1/StrS aminotransferase family protein [Terriglobales bacterium]
MTSERLAPPSEPQHQVPFYRPDIGEEEIAAVVDAIRSGWLSVGPRTVELERVFAEYVGARHALAVSSCTAALHLGLMTLHLQPEDEVITTTLTFAATGATIIHAGGRPVLADVTADTLNLDPADIARKITPRTRAIVPVHFAGHAVALDDIHALARQHNLVVLEDAAHAIPTNYRGRRIGGLSEMTAFSFYATKNLTTGEGGMLTTNDDKIAEEVRAWRLHGMSRDAWKRYSAGGSWRYDVSRPGFKYNMTDTGAAMGLVQLRRLGEMHRRRQQIAARYTELLADIPELELPVELPENESAWHLYVVRFANEKLSVGRDEIIELLKQQGVGTSVHFIPLHLHSYYRDRFGYRPEHFPVASSAAERILSLPFFTTMTDKDVEYVSSTLRRIIAAHRR